jgi:hypothetical protein
MKHWVFLVGAALGALATAVVVGVVVGHALRRDEDVPDAIAECFERIRQIEADLERLRPPA